MSGAYSALAAWFEYLNADCDYEKWSQYLYDRLRSLGVTGGKGLDIGCGSGAFTRAFAAFGFDMTGVRFQRTYAAKSGTAGRGRQGEIRSLRRAQAARHRRQGRFCPS